jgi:hypothetical protein
LGPGALKHERPRVAACALHRRCRPQLRRQVGPHWLQQRRRSPLRRGCRNRPRADRRAAPSGIVPRATTSAAYFNTGCISSTVVSGQRKRLMVLTSEAGVWRRQARRFNGPARRTLDIEQEPRQARCPSLLAGKSSAVSWPPIWVVAVQKIAATRSYASRFRLGGLDANAIPAQCEVEAIWLLRVNASLLRQEGVQGSLFETATLHDATSVLTGPNRRVQHSLLCRCSAVCSQLYRTN